MVSGTAPSVCMLKKGGKLMIASFNDEDGQKLTVEYCVTEDKDMPKAYGISAQIVGGDYSEARCRFYTLCEAERTLEMLAKMQVTPCTLCDII